VPVKPSRARVVHYPWRTTPRTYSSAPLISVCIMNGASADNVRILPPISTEFCGFALACTGWPLLMSLQLMTEQRVGGWVQRQGRKVVPRRKSKV
jgi:hypothetical protein